MTEQNPYVTSNKSLAQAGLWDQGWYNFRIESMTPQEKEVKNDNPKTGAAAGDKYHVITGRLVAFEAAVYDEDGDFDTIEELDREQSRFQDFAIAGNGLKRLKTLYRAITGLALKGAFNEEDGRYDDVDLLSTAEELIGSTAWNKVYHSKPDQNDNIYDNMSYVFTSEPGKKFKVKKDDDS